MLVADLVGRKDAPAMASYNREDCQRWAERYDIPLTYPAPEVLAERARHWDRSEWHREELPARAYYAARSTGHGEAFDAALFDAAWVEGLDVDMPDTIRWAASRAGLDGDQLLAGARGERPGEEARAALAEFDRLGCPAFRPSSSRASASSEKTAWSGFCGKSTVARTGRRTLTAFAPSTVPPERSGDRG